MTEDVLPAVLDPARLSSLAATGLMDSPAEAAFDRLTRLATKLLNAPIALVSLVDGRRQFFKSAVGLAEPLASRRETPLTHSYCKHVVADRQPLIVSNAREHPVLKHHLATLELGVVAYAGIPLILSDGNALGSFCVADDKAHEWSEHDIEVLRELAAATLTEIELRAKVHELTTFREGFRAVADSAKDAIITTDSEGTIVFWNQAATLLFGYEPDEILGKSIMTIIPGRLHEEYRQERNRQYIGETVEVPRVRKDGAEISVELSLSPWAFSHGVLLTASCAT